MTCEATAALTAKDALDEGATTLARAGIDAPRRDAALLLEAAAGLSRTALLANPARHLGREPITAYRALVSRRADHEPVSRILGRREFWSLPFAVSPATLDPRPDSETLIEGALALCPDRSAPLSILDFGTGTGCLLLALLSELPAATGVGIDICAAALGVAKANATALDLGARARFVAGDWGSALAGSVNLILANPPYIADRDFAGLSPEVARYEPRKALAGGSDGLHAYRGLSPHLGPLLEDEGHALLEVGEGQAGPVAEILSRDGLKIRRILRDLGGIRRCIIASL